MGISINGNSKQNNVSDNGIWFFVCQIEDELNPGAKQIKKRYKDHST
jgi:hypothetical protein